MSRRFRPYGCGTLSVSLFRDKDKRFVLRQFVLYWKGNLVESVLRMVAISLPFKRFICIQRVRIWENSLKKNRCKNLLSKNDIMSFAQSYPLNMGIIELAIKKAKQTKPTTKGEFKRLIEFSLESHLTFLQADHCVS